jgi:hypothetical protein
MNPRRLVISLLLAFTFLLPHSAVAENSKDFGEYVVHFNALATDLLPPQVAREYRITRSRNRGMVNITFRVANEETLKFTARVRPQGTQQFLEVHFSQDFYTN